MVNREISLYFHLPFCKRKCPYCHFFVLPERDASKELLQNALLRHLEQIKPLLANKEIPSIYFGGGTPTLFGAERVKELLSQIDFGPDCEITIEANPEEVTLELMTAYKSAGINRVSIGVQTLDDALLKTLGRTHSASKAIEAVHTTHQAGIDNISIDLMYELPGQTIVSFKETLLQVQQLPITHLSLYNLTIEPNTAFYKRREFLTQQLPTSEDSLAMLEMAVEQIEAAGLKRYEISAFAKDGKISRHNTGYWTARPFLGLGPSAFSYFEGRRFRNHCNLNQYAESLGIDFEETLPYPQSVKELLAVELRLLKGLEIEEFEKRAGILPPETVYALNGLVKDEMLTLENDRIRLSSKGLLFYDSVATQLI